MAETKNPDWSGPAAPDEEPAGITGPNVSMTKPPTPKGASYNKNAVWLILFALGLALGIAIVINISSGTKRAGNAQAATATDGSPSDATQTQDLTPAQFGKIPGSYGRTAGNGTSVDQPGLSGGAWGQEPGSSNKSSGDESYSIPVPPPVQSIPAQPAAGQPTGDNGPNLELQQLTAIRKSPIRFGNGNSPTANDPNQAEETVMNDFNKLAGQLLNQSGNSSPQTVPVSSTNDQNLQDEKRSFSSQTGSKPFYAVSALTAPLSPYEIKAGTIVPVVLITGLNSDLPGNVIAQVRENVYDTVSGQYLLIPQGTKAIGVYDSKVAYAQRRALVHWNRLIFPNGASLDIQNLAGIDPSGYTGLKDKVNNHTGKLVAGVFLTSVLGAAAEMAQGSTSDTVNPSYGQLAAEGAAQNLSDVGQQLTEKNLNVQPTLEIRPGFRFNLFVDKDFILQPYKR